LEAEILKQGPQSVSAFIGEPVVGATLGAVVPPTGYWPRIRQICDQYGILLISDEVMTGFGRTGRWFAMEHWGVMPDILVSAKGASSGYYPLGVVLTRSTFADALRQHPGGFAHGFTHANGVLGATAGLAVLRYLKKHDLIASSARMGIILRARLDALCDLPAVGDVRGLGMMAGVELVQDKASRQPFSRTRQVAERVQSAALKRGVNVYYGTGLANGLDGDAILLGPPFTVTEPQISKLVAALRAAIIQVTH
jgi:adenosylmethionine-8-amino-7-oxononanoate aminotransferase